MDPQEAAFLASSRGTALLDAARRTRGTPPHRRSDLLRGEGSPDEVRAALRQDDLRVRAASKAPDAEALLFTREALEQASAWPVATERAARWPGPADVPLFDLTGGIGLDALAAARAGRAVAVYERDEARATLLAANVRSLGLESLVDVRVRDAFEDLPSGPLAFLDPGRRVEGRRTRAPEAFDPPASRWPTLLERFTAAMVKLPPITEARAETPDEPLDEAREERPFEVVSLDGALRERRLFLGEGWRAPRRRALSLPRRTSVEGTSVPWPHPAPLTEGTWLLDPDPAVTAAGLVGDLALRDGLRPVHPRIAYLVGDRPREGSCGTWVRVDAVLPAQAREIDAWLRAHRVGRLTIRCRGVSDGQEAWRRRLHPHGAEEGTVVFLRDSSDRWRAVLESGPPGRVSGT